jgi:hypothetical protein
VIRARPLTLPLIVPLFLTVLAGRGGMASIARAQDSTHARDAATSYVTVAALGAALALDEPLRRFAATHQSTLLTHGAELVDPLGRAEVLVPALALSVVIPAALGRRSLAMDALHVAAGYAAADLAGGVVRIAVARHRPDSTGNAWRFRPLRPQGEWGSMPSAHVTHAFAIAAGVAAESDKDAVAAAAYGVASLVAVRRVYRQAQSSDVVAAAALASAVSRRVIARVGVWR